jgi:hypothetical protein
MKGLLLTATLACLLGFTGCSSDDLPIGAEAGDATISTGTGGEGSGPTGTGGEQPADNPAGDDIRSGGTGTDAP